MSWPVAAPDRLEENLGGILKNCALARRILVFQSLGSTNDAAAQWARDGAPEGTVIFAETQTAGRGRFGRAWASAAGKGLWFSLLLRPELPRREWARLSTLAAVAVARALPSESTAMIKWPNDIYLGDRKVAGILIETQSDFAVLGIGVNVNQTEFPEALAKKAVSLCQVVGRFLDRTSVAVSILRELDALYPRLAVHFPEILAEAKARNYLRGREVEVAGTAGIVRGIAETLDENGALVLRKADGGAMILHGGEATVTLSGG